MSTPYRVAVLIGSLRKDSYARKLAAVAIAEAPPSLELKTVEIGDLPLYNQDLEAEPPPAWTRFRQQMKDAQAVIFVTPEYNRSIPGALKNAVDVGSRPWGQSIWNGKPGAIVSMSMGAIGGFAANHHLRQSTSSIGVAVMPTPEAYIGNAPELFDSSGQLVKSDTREFLRAYMQSFATWVKALLG
jgi:chromate reductase